jgi:MFS family permease
MLDRLKRLHPFQTPDTQRLAILFAVVYFAQGMWALPNQTLIITLKERGLSAGQVATFFSFSVVPWLIKPAYGLLSDFVPLFGQRRRSYLLLTSALAAGAGLAMGLAAPHSYWWLVGLFAVMGLGLAFTDVLVDALMVENGQPRRLTGAFQAVQWGAIYTASVLVGELGGFLAERRSLSAAFVLAALFPLISFGMTLFVVHDPSARADREAFRQTMAAIRAALGERATCGSSRASSSSGPSARPSARRCSTIRPMR